MSPRSRFPLVPALILGLAAILLAAAAASRVRDLLSGHGDRAVGDGRNPATYGFLLDPCLVDREQIVGSGLPRDGIPALDFPPSMTAGEVGSYSSARGEGRRKYLVPSDRVIGIEIGGRARAYPLRVLAWHEIANDTLGGRPIAVTYSPLCDAAVVFSRERGVAAAPSGLFLFGHSGLLYNSDLLLYDRAGEGKSLYCQIQARAVTGPEAAASRRIPVLSCAVMPWSEWLRLHPETTVLRPDPAREERYGRDPYSSYYGSDLLRYPVKPLPPKDPFPFKTPCLLVTTKEGSTAFPFPAIREHAAASGTWRTDAGGVPLEIAWEEDPPAAWVVAPGPAEASNDAVREAPKDSASGEALASYAFWFACYSCEPGIRLIE